MIIVSYELFLQTEKVASRVLSSNPSRSRAPS